MRKKFPNITAHRGASFHAPENTLAAVSKAVELGADFIEIDVRLTKDENVIVHHDATTKRTCGENFNIANTNYRILKELNAAATFNHSHHQEKIPLLQDIIETVGNSLRLNIELKTTRKNNLQLAERTAEIIKATGCYDTCIVTSFDFNALKMVRQLLPKIRTGIIFVWTLSQAARCVNFPIYCIGNTLFSKRTLRKAKQDNKEIHIWTVDKKEQMLALAEEGIHNIITNDPALAIKVKEEYESQH